MNTIRRIFATALLLPALALAQTQEDRATLYSEIATNLAAGQSGGITAAQLRQVCNDTVASTYNLSDSNASVSITYTGAPISPMALHVFPQAIYIIGAGSGTPTTYTQSTESNFRFGLDYEEGQTMPSGVGITSLTFNDLVSGAIIYISQCANMTTASFPVLKDAEEFHMEQDLSITTLSLPNFVQTVLSETSGGGSGDFEISCYSLTTLSLPSLTTIGGGIGQGNGGFVPQAMPFLTTLSVPVLTTINGLYFPNTLPLLTTLSCPDLVTVTGQFFPEIMATLTTFSFPVLTTVGGNFVPTNFPLLTSMSLPDLVYVGGNFAPSTLADVTTFSFPVLATVGAPLSLALLGTGSFAPTTMAALTSLSFPALTSVGLDFSPTTMASVTTWNFPVLATIGRSFAPTTMAALTDLECNALQTVGGAFSITSMASLTTVSFSGMVTYGSTIDLHTSNGNLTSVTLGTNGTLKAINGATINISGQKLTSASVNAVLNLLVTLDGTNGTTAWGSGKTLTINGGTNGAPTGQGITDKATLVARGATITTN